MVSAVARNDCELLQLQRDLESEGVEWSNKKIVKVVASIKTLLHMHAAGTEETRAGLRDELTSKCIQTKQSDAVIEAIMQTIEGQDKLDIVKTLRLRQLEDF